MLEYLQKFSNLPVDLRQKVSGREAMKKIEALEKKYNIALAALIMRVMVKEVALNDLLDYLLKENLSKERAAELARELKEKIFSSLGNYFLAGEVKRLRPVRPAVPVLAEPLTSEPEVKGASFFFSPDDEEEIRQLTKKVAIAENLSLAPAAIDNKLKEIVSRAQINFGSADLADRFSQILKTYLRGIRNKLETKAALMKPFSSGGLSFDEDSTAKAILLADKVFNFKSDQPIKPLPKIKLPELEKSDFPPRPEISREAAYDFSKLAVRDDKMKKDLKKIEPESKSDSSAMPLIKRRFKAENLSQSQKVKIEDVKYVPRVMGPLDEIKYMDLINFRRLDRDPFRAADKIKSKINLLEEEDYAKKFEGIKFWRLSPINKLYLEIGGLSIGENKPVDVIIEERKIAGSDYLTADEFKAIMDLNKSLRF